MGIGKLRNLGLELPGMSPPFLSLALRLSNPAAIDRHSRGRACEAFNLPLLALFLLLPTSNPAQYPQLVSLSKLQLPALPAAKSGPIRFLTRSTRASASPSTGRQACRHSRRAPEGGALQARAHQPCEGH